MLGQEAVSILINYGWLIEVSVSAGRLAHRDQGRERRMSYRRFKVAETDWPLATVATPATVLSPILKVSQESQVSQSQNRISARRSPNRRKRRKCRKTRTEITTRTQTWQ